MCRKNLGLFCALSGIFTRVSLLDITVSIHSISFLCLLFKLRLCLMIGLTIGINFVYLLKEAFHY